MYYGRDSQKTDRELYLENELERYRRDEEERYERQEVERQERRRQQKESWEVANRTASTWPEALRKQAYLFEREANEWPPNDPDFPCEPDDLFGPGAAACKYALSIWDEVAASKRDAIEALEAQIKTIKDSVRIEVADKVESQGNNVAGWKQVAQALREHSENELSAWLNW